MDTKEIREEANNRLKIFAKRLKIFAKRYKYIPTEVEPKIDFLRGVKLICDEVDDQAKEIKSLHAELKTWETTHIGMHYGSKREADRMARLVKENKRLREALEWYATQSNYFYQHGCLSDAAVDSGRRAQVALQDDAVREK